MNVHLFTVMCMHVHISMSGVLLRCVKNEVGESIWVADVVEKTGNTSHLRYRWLSFKVTAEMKYLSSTVGREDRQMFSCGAEDSSAKKGTWSCESYST